MTSVIQRCVERDLIPVGSIPNFFRNNMIYEAWTGSVSYGVSNDSSDMDIVGVVIPRKTDIFPHLAGKIIGFGSEHNGFKDWQMHRVEDKERQKTYDMTVYGIVRFFDLCMANNPNMVDALFVPRRCVLYINQIGEHIRSHRKEFLHKGSYYKFRGYALQQMNKIRNKTTSKNPKRAHLIEQFGYDTKFAYHAVRLMLQIEQIMIKGDLKLDDNVAILRSVRNGEWTLQKLEEWMDVKEKAMETLYSSSTLPIEPNQDRIKEILLECLEMHYGNLGSDAVSRNKSIDNMIDEIDTVINKYRNGNKTLP